MGLPSFTKSDFVGLTVLERLARVAVVYARDHWVIERVDAPPGDYAMFESLAGHHSYRMRVSESGLEVLVLGVWVKLSCVHGPQSAAHISVVHAIGRHTATADVELF